jgi:hypothetical protein
MNVIVHQHPVIEFKSESFFVAFANLKIFFKIRSLLEYWFLMVASADDVVEH